MQVRALAEQYQLPTRHRKDSQGICFLGKLKVRPCALTRPTPPAVAAFSHPALSSPHTRLLCVHQFDDFIAHYLSTSAGPIVCYRTGRALGTHRGLWYHTIGQRKGLGPYLDAVVHEGPWCAPSLPPSTATHRTALVATSFTFLASPFPSVTPPLPPPPLPPPPI